MTQKRTLSIISILPKKHTRNRRRMELNLRYRLRPSQAQDLCPRPLQIRLTMDGKTISDYSSGIKIRPSKWNQENQMIMGRNKLADELNEHLAQIEAQHRDILRELKRRYGRGEGPRPTPELVKAEFLKPGSSSPTLDELYTQYLDHLDSLSGSEDEKAEKTMNSLYKTRKHLRAFDVPLSPQLLDMTTNWGKRFHVWLQVHPENGKRRMQKDTANRHLSHVRDALDYAIDEGYLSTNPLDKFRPKRGKGKPVYFLDGQQFDKLVKMKTSDPMLANVLWWCKLMIHTGLDYIDAKRYVKDRARFEGVSLSGRRKIIIARSKPPQNVCEIPLLDQIEQLFALYPTGPPPPLLAEINRHLKVIQTTVGATERLTSKILRKTAGAFFLRKGYSVAAVSKFLGHSSVRTTEQHYLKITSEYVDLDMDRVNKTE